MFRNGFQDYFRLMNEWHFVFLDFDKIRDFESLISCIDTLKNARQTQIIQNISWGIRESQILDIQEDAHTNMFEISFLSFSDFCFSGI